MSTLAAVWQSITAYLNDGISIIPIRDKDDDHGVAKSPYGKTWGQWQKNIVSKDQLWQDMERFKTEAIGIVTGAVSGNLEAIDADEKYMPGISARLFADIQTLYPDLWPRLRVHGTPSKGFHLIYRCTEPVPGNQKLAGRYKDVEELAIAARPKQVNFLETRGEGGYIAGPPALNYTVVQDVPITTLTKDERDALINLCRSYTYITAATNAPYKPTKQDSEYYDTNPFDDFNNRCNPSDLMQELGWTEYKHNNKFVWYTRPDKVKGVSLSFNIDRRFFFCFTASTELDENKGYTPANLLATCLHNGDKKKTYHDLVKRGFGVIKPDKEADIAKRAATNSKPLPPNISPTAAALHVEISKQLAQDHPYGIFWYNDKKQGILINREQLYIVADGLGFKLANEGVVQVIDNIIYQRDARYFFDEIKGYIREEDSDLYQAICNSYEGFIERHGKFTLTRLQLLNPVSVILDTRTDCYKFYSNGMLHIQATGFKLLPVPKDKFVWFKSIQPREFTECNTGKYVDFIEKSIGLTQYLLNCIGYLVHDYKDETAGYIVILSEQCQNPKDGGGSGKNIFSFLLSKITTFFSKAGSQVKYDEKFMQAWNYQKIFSISDVLKNFNFEFLKEFTAGSATMKKLHVDEYSINPADMPKFLISTNFSYEIKDGGIKRRVRPIEFTDFFTKQNGVDVYYDGAHFPNDWTAEDWGGFDTTMCIAVQSWLKSGRKLEAPTLTEGGWHKQFEQSYGKIINGIINEYFDTWCQLQFVSNDQFKMNCDSYYSENNTNHKYRPSSFAFNDALTEYCKKNNIAFKKDASERLNSIVTRGRSFEKVTK